MGVGNHDRAARVTGTRAGAVRGSLWRQVTAGCGPDAVAVRYATLARVGAGRAGPAAFARSAREDVARLATALGAVLELHTPDHWHHCRACTAGQFLVDWPCRTRRAIDHGLDHGWPPNPAAPTDPTGPADSGKPNAPDGSDGPADAFGAHESHEGFALAVLAVHDILPAAGGQPACCRACHLPPDRCPVWALAEGFLGITWIDPAGRPTPCAPLAATRTR